MGMRTVCQALRGSRINKLVKSQISPFPIGVGTIHWFESPLPPNRTGGFPASGSPVGGFTSLRTGVINNGPPQD